MSVAEAEATRHKRRKMNKYQAETTEQVTPAAPSSPPPCTPASLPSAAPETPILGEAVAERRKERRRKRKREQVAPPPSAAQTPIHIGEEAAGMRKKKRRTRGHEQQQQPMASSPSSPTAAAGTLLEAAAAVAARKQERKRSKEPFHGQTHCVQLRGNPSPPGVGGEEADGRRGKSVKRCSSNKSRVLSTREIIRTRIELRKQQPLPQGLFHAMDMASNPSANSDSNSIQQGHGYSSPFGAFFDQFCYKPSRQDRSPPIPRTPDLLARPPPHGHLSSGSSQLMANETSKINPSKITRVSKRKQAGSASGSASLKQEKTKLKEKEMPVKEAMVKKVRKPPPLLSAAEKRSDKYRRLPLDQLVPPPRSPHRLLQEKYASDPWKVIVICMLLNLTQGKQVRKKVKGFFKRYPDAQTALNADPEKMANYLAPLGLQRVKANRIQKLSKAYVENEWTYVTELCGVGKYAADAYAIFCAGKATEVVPEDHKLVDYWKYVCFELPMIQQAQNMQEAGVTEMEHAVHKVEELAVCC